jgi:hypothetical protein
MTDTTTPIEERLGADLLELPEERRRDEEFGTELYRALAGLAWRHRDLDGAVALSWKRAEAAVNVMRHSVDRPPLALAQSGREGELSNAVRDELARLGWTPEPRVTQGASDPRHSSAQENPPPNDAGKRHKRPDADEWERRAHEEAEAERLRKPVT